MYSAEVGQCWFKQKVGQKAIIAYITKAFVSMTIPMAVDDKLYFSNKKKNCNQGGIGDYSLNGVY